MLSPQIIHLYKCKAPCCFLIYFKHTHSWSLLLLATLCKQSGTTTYFSTIIDYRKCGHGHLYKHAMSSRKYFLCGCQALTLVISTCYLFYGCCGCLLSSFLAKSIYSSIFFLLFIIGVLHVTKRSQNFWRHLDIIVALDSLA